MHAPPSVSLRRLAATPADTAALQEVIEASPRYSVLTSGVPPPPDSAAGVLAALPPGRTMDHKFVYAIALGDELVGCVDLVRDFPAPGTAMLGLLLVAESHQGRGIGRAACERIEAIVRGWPGMQRLRIGVVEANDGVLPFWRRLGFAPTGEVRPYVDGTVVSRVIVLERQLDPRS